MGNNVNVKVQLPATNELTATVSGLSGLIVDLQALGVEGVTVLAVKSESGEPSFLVQLSGQQLAGLINQHAYNLLSGKYGV